MSGLSGPESHSPTPINPYNLSEAVGKMPSHPSEKTGFFQKAHAWARYNSVSFYGTLSMELGSKVNNTLQSQQTGIKGSLIRNATLAGCCVGILAFSAPLTNIPFFTHRDKHFYA